MVRRYSLGKRCIAYLLLVNLLLQSCGGPNPNSNTPSPRLPAESLSKQEIVEEQERDKFLLAEKDFEKEGEEIGKGSYGKVYKCKIINNNNPCARKVIEFNKLGPESKEKLIKSAEIELAALKNLEHKNVIRLIGYHIPPSEDSLMIMMDLCDMSLNKYLEEHWTKHGIPLTPTVTKKVARNILRGLNYLHNERVAHRDIKPENILVKIEKGSRRTINSLYLTDFGVSKIIEDVDSEMTAVGTPNYMPPEQLECRSRGKAKGNFDPFKGDVYAFGKVLYKCVTGNNPQESDLNLRIVDKSKRYDVIVDMFEKSTQKNPNNRPTCKELLAILKGKQPQQLPWYNNTIVVMMLVLAVAVVGGLIGSYIGNRAPQHSPAIYGDPVLSTSDNCPYSDSSNDRLHPWCETNDKMIFGKEMKERLQELDETNSQLEQRFEKLQEAHQEQGKIVDDLKTQVEQCNQGQQEQSKKVDALKARVEQLTQTQQEQSQQISSLGTQLQPQKQGQTILKVTKRYFADALFCFSEIIVIQDGKWVNKFAVPPHDPKRQHPDLWINEVIVDSNGTVNLKLWHNWVKYHGPGRQYYELNSYAPGNAWHHILIETTR